MNASVRIDRGRRRTTVLVLLSAVPLIGGEYLCVLASIFAEPLVCHRAGEVRGPHAGGPNGRRLIGRQTHDLNESRERIKCVLSAAFILLSCPPFISHSFLGGVACSLGGLVEGPGGRGGGLSSWFWKPVGLLLMETTPVAGWKVTLTNSTCPVLYSQ